MVGQHGINLAISLIRAHFGDLVAKVCGCLLQRGTLSLPEIARFAELTNSQVKNCLLVLIQHNCVQAFSNPVSGGFRLKPRVTTFYMALFDNILHRLRFAKFLAIVKADLGPQCEVLLEGLLQHGRLTFEQLMMRAASKKPGGTADVRDVLRVSFGKLVHARYVERCPRPEPFIEPPSEEDSKPGKKRGSKSKGETVTIEQQAMMAAALSDAERFSEITDVGTEAQDLKVTNESPGVSVGDKRKHEVLELDQEVQVTITENEVLWRANFVKFVHILKKQACVANVRSRMGLDAAVVLEAMIESSSQQKGQEKNSVTASMDGILEALGGKPGGSMTLQNVRTIIDQLRCLSCIEGTGATYSIDLKRIIETCQNDELEKLVETRYGKEAYRIFRLLIKNGRPVETDQITQTTLVEKKDAQGILYKLWKDDYLDMEKVISQGVGQTQLFLWKVNKNALQEHILNDMYHAAFNLSQKIADIFNQEHEVVQDEKRYKRLKKSRMILELSLLKLDDALMLMHGF